MGRETLGEKFKMDHFQHPDNYGDWIGYRIESLDMEGKKSVTALTTREDHLSPSGKVHGGVVSGFFDFSCGATVFTTLGKGDVCSTVELKVNYLQPISVGAKIEGRTEVVFRGKKICVVHGFLFVDGSEKPSAMVTGTFNVVEGKK